MSDMESGPPRRVKLTSFSAEQTQAIGCELGSRLPAAVTVAMVGRLGAGKTCFVRGLAEGLGIDPDEIASPTFVYMVDHTTGNGRRRLYHADLYRLAATPEEHASRVFESIGLYAAIESDGITAIEWWEYYRGPAPTRLVTVEFVAEKADDRLIFFELSGPGLASAADWLAAAGQPADEADEAV